MRNIKTSNKNLKHETWESSEVENKRLTGCRGNFVDGGLASVKEDIDRYTSRGECCCRSVMSCV